MLKGDIWRLNEVLVEFDVVKLHQIVHQNEFGCIELHVLHGLCMLCMVVVHAAETHSQSVFMVCEPVTQMTHSVS